ncbi:hypothetical protein [Haloprofundus sp. MHR1]|uniref:hypothetical protein n=1 Tax=Haloprofundus sp. MHR1 TaxID=2572921 RepID=UPI0010BED28E|nr:hypothetical protein [Haloprofundus sp. MHR1]QCJ47900.1 hypothetical protein FCF25_12580 [Haloprofundus sp. MHR1]
MRPNETVGLFFLVVALVSVVLAALPVASWWPLSRPIPILAWAVIGLLILGFERRNRRKSR